MGGQSEKVAIYKQGKGPSPEPDHAGTLISYFQPPELWEINVKAYGILLQQTELTVTYTLFHFSVLALKIQLNKNNQDIFF